jgi:hypothetical protein
MFFLKALKIKSVRCGFWYGFGCRFDRTNNSQNVEIYSWNIYNNGLNKKSLSQKELFLRKNPQRTSTLRESIFRNEKKTRLIINSEKESVTSYFFKCAKSFKNTGSGHRLLLRGGWIVKRWPSHKVSFFQFLHGLPRVQKPPPTWHRNEWFYG